MGEDEGDQGFVRLIFEELPPGEMEERAGAFFDLMDGRRTTRHFSDRPVPRELIETVLDPLGTEHVKQHITEAPWVVVLFRHSQRQRPSGEMSPTYYSQESCGIAAGLFVAAIHNMGLVTLTHTPSPMGFLKDILERPEHEHAMLLLPVGFPAGDAMVPDIKRKDVEDVLVWRE